MESKCIPSVFNRSNYTSPLKWPKQFLSDLKCCIDRCRKGYCDRDLWAMNDWFLNTIPNMLEELDKKRCGFPSYLEYEYYEQHKEELDIPFEEFVCWPADKASEGYKMRQQANYECTERWGKILREIAYYLHEAKNAEKDDAYRAECLNKGLALFEKYFEHLWD